MPIRCFFSPLRSVAAAIAAFGLCLSFAAPARAQRLPQTVRPEHYTLAPTPDLKTATFSGVESIDVTLAEPANAITLNAIEIAFDSVTVTAGGQQQTATVTLDPAKQRATFTFPARIPAGPATLSIRYTGILNNELRGFYLSRGDHRDYAVTQFESTDARRAFPSFDEPAFKATFDVTLTVDRGDTAISNEPIAGDTPGPGAGQHTLRFDTTPKMSTYLLAFLVGDFQCSSGSSDGVAIRVCSTPDKVALTHYGLGVAERVLHYYDSYFGISYPLKKLDLIALPDFEAGAMENFGAITYRETDLLLDPQTASAGAKQEVALVIAHEMAHQWFGDLVTMQWWNNIWLNEGFATWMESKAVAHLYPQWKIDQTEISGINDALNLDALATTRAIRAKADTPEEINQMFDGISYGKAAAVLLSVENYLGEETFRQGVHRYLEAHLYANATAQDFWNAQTAVSHKPVNKIMESLVAQPGEPILTFGVPANGRVAVSQQRFYLDSKIHPNPAQKWTLPVCFKTGTKSPDGSGQECEVLTPETNSLQVPANSLFFANAGGKGYYRSAYPPSVCSVQAAHVETGLTPGERIRLIGDEWALVEANQAPIGASLDLAAGVRADPNAEVMATALDGVEAAYTRVAATPREQARLAAWIRSTYRPEYARLGPPAAGDSDNERGLRARLFTLLGEYGKDPAILAEARRIAGRSLADPASVEPTLGQAALAVAARNGDAALFDRLEKMYETSANPDDQEDALRLLAEFENPALLRRALDYAVSGKVRNQDAIIQFAIALQIPSNRAQTWNYIQQNWTKVEAQFTTEMGAVMVGSTGSFCSAGARASVEQFFSTHKVASSSKSLQHALERIDSCIELRTLQEPKLDQWLESQPRL